MNKIKAKHIAKPERLPSQLSVKTEDIIMGVNAGLNPGKPIINWFQGDPDARAAVCIKNGELVPAECDGSIITGGEISAGEVTDLMVVDYKGIGGGVYVEGGDSRVVAITALLT
ncbi:MAG: hypothetical protein HGA22_03280, partial [Clostridiales bacterium]|nr:hypothetical protein [Clostridiales bacterium]